MPVCGLVAAFLLAVQGPQDLGSNPVLRAFQLIGDKGLAATASAKTSPGKFKPQSSSTLDGSLKSLVDGADERKLVWELTGNLIEQFEGQMKGKGLGNDAASAAAFAMTVFAASITESAVSDDGFLALTKQLQEALNRPEVLNAGDVRKQQVYEFSLMTAAIALLATQAETPEGRVKAKQMSSAMLRTLTGVTPDQLKVVSGKIRIAARPAPALPAGSTASTPAPSNAGYAPAFGFSVPAGWEARQGWYVRENVGSLWEGHREVTGAMVRVLPAIPAKGNMGTALGELWKVHLPAEAQGKQSGMVYRRYVGDGILSQFVWGMVRDKGRDVDTSYTLLLLDCKTHWQPVVVAGTFDDNTAIRSTVQMVARSRYDDAAMLAEEMLRTFRCAPAKGAPIATVEALAGDYSFGDTSTLWTENIYTGATSMSYVASGGTLNLKPNGTFAWKMNIGNGRDGVLKTSKIEATGRWSIQGDILHLAYETYDQGDRYKAKDKRYKIAGLSTFSDGVKVAVLMYHSENPVNLTTVGDQGDWYTTKRK